MVLFNDAFQLQATQQQNYFFHVNLVAPTNNPVRMQYAQLMEGELPKVGISAELDLVTWDEFGSRATNHEVGQYSTGGYDICFLGSSDLGNFNGHPGDFLQSFFGANAIPPLGFNFMYWSSETGMNYNNLRAQESDSLIQNITTNLNLTKARIELFEWQKLWYDVMPNVIIYNEYEVHAISKGLYGYDPIDNPLNSIEDVWLTSDYTGTTGQIVLAASSGGDTFNPMIANDVYDHYGNNPVFDGLVANTPSKEAVLPSGTSRETWMLDLFNTTNYLDLYPRLAETMGTYSSDGLSYSIDVKEGVKWHDGETVDAWDIAFSFQAHLIPDLNSSQYSNLVIPFGTDNKTGKHGNYSFTVTDPNGDGFFENIVFNFIQPFPPFVTDYLGWPLLPEHILGDPVNHGLDLNGSFDFVNLWNVAPSQWKYHSTTTGRKLDRGGYAGPIGCGSMIFKNYDSDKGEISLEKFKDIRWDNETSTWVTAPGISHWNIDNLDNMPNTAKIIVTSMDHAIDDMKTGEVNIMDPQFTMANILGELHAEASVQPILSPNTGWQAIYFNPKFVEDGVYHLQKKGVRHAISHVVPRDDIITYLINGLGVPGYTPVSITSWGAISEADMLAYKKTVTASDGTTPESSATTAYDEYSFQLAFKWLESEDYDVPYWPPTTTTTTITNPQLSISYIITLMVLISPIIFLLIVWVIPKIYYRKKTTK